MHSFLLSTLSCTSATTSITTNSLRPFLRNKGTLKLATQFEAIYQFGDSLNDNGNFIRQLPGGPKSAVARLPYGETLKRPTGRASDGLIMVDYIAMNFQLPPLIPYLANGSNFTHGVNFAVFGATATGGIGANSLASQLDWFKSHLKATYSSPAAIKEKLQKSLVMMGEIGGNDFNGPFYRGKTIPELTPLIPIVVQTIKDAVEEVISLGANNIVVPGNFPIGCVPLYLVNFATNDTSKYDELQCLKDYNDFSKLYNQQLIQAIQQLQQEHPNVAIVYADYYSALIWVITNSPQLGIEPGCAKKACCGTGSNPYNYDGHKFCGSPGVSVCPDPTKRISWDGVHMTQQGNKCVANLLVKQFAPKLQKNHVHIPHRKPIR
ncbi:hypothetical protein BVRB_7g157440 [Beta vulgaris subsp. vulgaris]|nr:hypothetical protein BVRB_7g157440 [Beta vulgaris subsp. vulgaris]